VAKGLCSAKRGKGPKDRASGRERANRRLPIGRALEESRRSGQAAVLQDAILRYSRLAVCATNTAEARNTYPAPVWSLDFFHVQWPGARVGRSDTGQKTRPIPAGATPQVKGPKNNPKRQRRGPILQIIERRMLVPHRVSKPFSGVRKTNAGCRRQGRRPNSTSVMPRIEMERAFSALAPRARLPSPLGWYHGRLWRSPIRW